MRHSLADFAGRALRCIAEEAPEHACALARKVPTPLEFVPELGPAFGVVSMHRRLEISARPETAVVRIELRAAVVDELIRGRTRIVAAVEAGALEVRGTAEACIALEDGFRLFLLAAAKTISIDALREEWIDNVEHNTPRK